MLFGLNPGKTHETTIGTLCNSLNVAYCRVAKRSQAHRFHPASRSSDSEDRGMDFGTPRPRQV